MYVYYGNGDGTFSPPVTAGVYNQNFTSLTTADLNNDGLTDFIFHSKLTDGGFESVGIVHAKFGRTFDQMTTYTAGSGLSSLDIADLNRDGFPDLVFANGDPTLMANAYTVLLNLPNPAVTGTLTASPEPSVVNQPFTLTATLSAPDGSKTALSGPIAFAIDGANVGTATLANDTASLSATTPLTIGTHEITAAWPGDNTYPGLVLHATHTVTGYPVVLTITAQPNPAPVGSPVTYSASVVAANPSDPEPTGNITITDNGTTILFDVGPIAHLQSIGTRGFSPGGNHVLTLNYTGDALHSPASASTTFFLTPVASNITLQGSPNPSNYSQPVTFTAKIGDILPPGYHDILGSGTVTFTGLPGGPVTVSVPSTVTGPTNTVTYTTSTLPPGSYTVTASFSGNPSLNPSTSSPIKQTVISTATTTTLTANPTTAYQNQTITLSAQVTGPLTTPTGTIRFLDGVNPLSTVTLTSGSATLSTTQLAVGTHTITAVYSGDAVNQPSNSAPVTVTIQSSDFTLTLNPAATSLVTGHHTTLKLTAQSVGVFADTLHFSVGPLPKWVTLTCNPTEPQLAQGSTATTSLYVDTDAVIGYMSQTRPTNPRPSRTPEITAALALILAPFALRRRRLAALLSFVIAAALLAGATGCSGKYPDSTTPGTYNLQITATGIHTGLTHTITLPLTVTAPTQ